jgi:soluble lytic murein transglycosylase
MIVLWLAAGAGVAGCHGGNAPEARPPAEPSSASGLVASWAAGDAGDADGGEAALDAKMRIAVVLDDPRLTAARDRQDAGDPSAAAREVERARAAAAVDGERACAWDYVAASLHEAAEEHNEAAAGFERVAAAPADAATPCTLAPYALLREAEALVHAGRFDEAAAKATAVGDEIAAREEARVALADALSSKGDRAGAVAIWRTLLTSAPHRVRWVDLSLLLAGALLDGVDGPPESRAQEALDLTTRVLVEAPIAAEKLDVLALRSRAATALKRAAPPPLNPEERARQAQAWLDGQQPKRALEAAEALLKALPKKEKAHHEAACKAAIVRAQATPRGKADDAAEAWGAAIARCEGEDALVTALYHGAKASASARRPDDALARFARVEKLFPQHRLADDARLRAAQLLIDHGDEARALAMLASLPDAYPDGDMRGEALFRVAFDKLSRHDLDGARAAFDRMLAVAPEDRGWGSAGRGAYFRARVAQLSGDLDDAKTRYASIVRDQPLTYYMLLAYTRLRALDDALARSTVQSAVSREATGPFLTRDHDELATPAFARFARLLEVGELDAARREAGAGGLVADGVDPDVVWTVAWMYDQAGAPDVGHAFGRGRMFDYRAHWPAGRWRLAWQATFPRAWDPIVVRESEAARIPTPLTWAIMREESAFNPDAHSVANAIGLMQLLAGTARQIARGTALTVDEQALHRPDVSIALGARLLGSLRASFSANPMLAIAAYNGGSVPVRRWLAEHGGDELDVFVERIPFEETRAYVKRVLSTEAAYAYLYAPKAMDELLALPARAAGQDLTASP